MYLDVYQEKKPHKINGKTKPSQTPAGTPAATFHVLSGLSSEMMSTFDEVPAFPQSNQC